MTAIALRPECVSETAVAGVSS